MRDEEFVFMSDVREKKRTASGAFHKRTHAGKGGAIKFPSDFLSRKELKAMSGEVKSYNINNPMTWKEFKALPDDIKIVYIKLLREKFGVSDTRIFKMFGISQTSGSRVINELGIGLGKNTKHKNFDAAGWEAWLNGNKKVEESVPACESIILAEEEPVEETVPVPDAEAVVETNPVLAVPYCGVMNFDGDVSVALETVRQMLGCSVGHLHVSWSFKEREAE